jgi:acetylornithine deacetylase/succinyl-diaminopimelate desuccinylase
MQSLGAEAFIRACARGEGGLREMYDGAIVGEPTQNRLALGHKGLEWLSLEFTGRAAHGGTPSAGINAIAAAARFIGLVRSELVPRLQARPHSLLGAPTVNFGTISGGDQPSTVARTCTLTLDRRSVPGETFESLAAELNELLAKVRSEFPGLETRLARVEGGMATMEHLSTALDANHPLARAVAEGRQSVTGAADPPTTFPAWTDAALLSHFGGIPSLVCGPGDLAVAHTPGEFVPLEEVEAAARIYARATLAFCAP